MGIEADILVELARWKLPEATPDKAFFCDMRGEDSRIYRMEIYYPDSIDVYLRKLEDAKWSAPRFVSSTSSWDSEGVEKVIGYVKPDFVEHVLGDGYGLNDISDDHFSGPCAWSE